MMRHDETKYATVEIGDSRCLMPNNSKTQAFTPSKAKDLTYNE